MKRNCPNIDTKKCSDGTKIVSKSKFYRKSDSRWIQRYQCKSCGRTFSRATGTLEFGQNKRRTNFPLYKLLASGVSQRRAAKILGINVKTVARKLVYLGKKHKKGHESFLKRIKDKEISKIQFDEMYTIEHTKCKPLSIAVAVEKKSRTILGLSVSSSPPTGKLANIAYEKYGWREDKRKDGIEKMLLQIKKSISTETLFETDESKIYPQLIKKHFPNSTHKTYKSERSCVVGQGELKKVQFDPIFSINQTLAMFRGSVNRLIRRSWCTTKKPNRLLDHLYLYISFHNKFLTSI